MNRKLDSVTYLLISTMRSILQSPDNWREFLDTAARNYKYPFSDQVMIFAQKPDATAVASFDTWVSKLNRYVRRGSKGIVLIDQATNPPKLHYVFDVSDTGKGPHGKSVNFWEIRSEHVDAVHERLEHEFDAEGSTIPDQLIDIAAKLVINYWEDHQDDIDESWSYALNNSDNQSAWEDLQLITANSVAYILLKRAGYDPADYLNESCFDNVSAFQDETFQRNFLGTAVHHCSFSALHTIELSIKNFELEKKTERSATNEQRRNQVHESGRASVPESVSGRGSADAAGQMGLDAQNVSHGTPGAVVHDDANRRESVGASAGDRPVSNGDVRADDGQRSTELRRNRESESNRSDEMGRTNEHNESTSGRSNSSRSDLFVNSEPNAEQLSMFDFPVYPSENEQIQSMAEATSANTPSAFSVSQEEIDRELRAYHGKLNIYGMYQQNLPTESIVAAIKKGYGICGHSTTLLDGTNAFVDFRPATGMEFWRDPTDKKFIVKWSALENRIRQLIREGSYLTPKELEKYQSDHLEEHADVEVDISRDLTASAVQPTFFFGYNDIKHDHPDDIVLYQVGDFFEMYGEDAKNASTILNLSLTSRHIPDVGRVSMCGIPAHQLEQYVEQLRDEYDVTVAAIDEDNGQREVHSVLSIDHEAERAINAHEAEYGADGWRAFPGNKPTPTVRELYNQYKPMISAAVVADEAYRNACRNSDRENAYLEGAAAVKRAVLASGDMQLLRLYSDMTEFHNRLHREVLDETYPKLQSQPRSMSQEDRFLSESEKQEPGIIGAVFEYDNTLYEVVKIDHDEDIGDLAVIRDMASPKDAPKMTVEPLEFVQILVQEQQMPAVASSQGKAVSDRDYSYEYRLLDRLHNDCEYFLGAGQRSEKHLWAGNVHAQIAKMRELYETLPEKPEWLTEEAIDSYADRMAPRYLVVAYHHFENGFDEKLDYQTLSEAEKAAQGYMAGTMEHDGFAYDGAAVYDQQERKYLRIYGDYPDEAAKAQVEVPVYEASKSILSDSLFPAQEVPQAVIDQALYTAGNSFNSAYRVAVFYMRERPEADCIAFLRREFGTENGRGIEYEGRKYAVWFMEDGIHLAQGDSIRTGYSPTVVTWERASARILELLEAGTYLSAAELEQAPDKVLSEMADALLMTARELNEEGRAKGLFPQTLAIHDQLKGYPELDADVVAFAKRDGGLNALAEEYHTFLDAYAQDDSITRFRLSQYNTHRIGVVLDGLSYPERSFTAQPDFLRQCKMFITQDEIDRFFLSGSVEGRLSVYSHFCYPHTPDENQKFIKGQFGEYSGGGYDGYDYTKTYKGLTYQRDYARKRYDEVKLTIPNVVKTYERLIAQKRFPGEDAIAQIPQYEIERLARVVYFGFYDAPDEISRPYPKHADYYAAIPAIEAQLQDKEKTAEILRTLSSWLDNMDESNRCFNSCLKAKNQLSAYVNGTFSLFNHRHDDLQQNRPASSTIPNQSVLSIAQHDSMIPTYKVGDTVYLDDKPFEITNIGDFDVQLRDPSLLYPVFRAESRQRFEKMLEQDERNNVYHDEVVSKPMQFIAHFYVVDDLQVQDQLTVTEYVSLEDALKAYQALPNTQMKSLGIQNTNRLPGSLDFIQCIDGKDTLIHDYMQISGWKNPEINAVVHRIEKMLEESKSEIFASYEQENPTGGLDDTPSKESHETPVAIQIDGEWQTFPNVASAEKAAYEESKVEIRRNAQNFHITDDALGVGGPKAKYQANINAIKLLKYLEADGRQALPEQQEVLSRYVGWGGLPDAFDPGKPAWAAEYTELKGLLTDEEYAAARASTLNAHYTSPTVIRSIYDAVGQMGFETGNILEPAMGIGNFFGMLPPEMQSSRLFGIELDSITGRIAKQLYPKADITVAGFETTNRPNFYDLAIGNVPFGQYQVNDPSFNKLHFNIHNYFFAKALDQVRPGGIVAFVTTRYTMDAKDSTVRKYLAERADLLGAIRLPNNAFKENAGAEVVSDIIFLQKRDDPIVTEPDWVHLGVDDHGYAINRYFLDNPDMVLGQNAEHSTAHGMDYTVIPDNLTSLADQLHAAVGHIHGSYDSLAHVDLDAATADNVIPADPNVKNFSYTIKNDTVYYRENSIMSVPDFKRKGKHVFDRIRALIPLRNCVQELLDMQANGYPTDEELASKQDELDTLYDSFVAKYGRITEKANEVAFSNDDSYFLLCSLEVLDDNRNFVAKSPFFTERTIRPSEVIDHVDTPAEALELSMAERGKIDLPYMANLLNRDDYAEITKELQGAIFRDPEIPNPENSPTVGWVIADEYLSGNVRHKLRAAQAAAAQQPEFKANVSVLTEVQPKDLDASEIEARLGATWIPLEYISQFMHETFNTSDSNKERFPVRYSPITNEWRIEHCGSNMSSDVVATVKYGTSRINAYEILERTLNLKDVLVYDYFENPDGSKKAVLNTKATTLAQEKQRLIREAFKDWIWKDPVRRVDLVHRYNEEMNNLRNREYDGSHLRFVGMSSSITLKEHQRNAIAHILYGGNTLLAHSVGAGKTFEMVAAAMESKRLGLCNKSLFAVPNHIVNQFASEFLQLYPNANILVAREKDFETKNRKKFCAKIATGNYDAVIMGHSQFEKIPLSYERQAKILELQIEEITNAIASAKYDQGLSFSVKSLERTRNSLQTQLQQLTSTEHKDNVVTFEQLGVDRLFIDEAHNYKNLYLYTKMQNVAGISNTKAKKSSDLFMKCQYLDEITGGRGTIFATGTPVSNSMTELYTMQRYLQSSYLQSAGLNHFDSWAARFGETVMSLELAPEGTGYRMRNRFARFFNLPELMTAFRQCADIKTADQLDLNVPEAEYHIEVAKPTEHQVELVQALSDRAVEIHNGRVDPSIDNMLKITSDGRKLGLDQRILNPLLPDEPGTKVNMCVRNILQIYKDTADDKLTQLVFSDISTPKGNGEFNIYDDIKSKLVANGVPASEIAFIHDAKNDKQKEIIFSKVRSGDIRILLGSTQKMGAGTNVQKRLIALHDLDCPWKPGDLEQRSGRIIRQGNQNAKVHIYRYVTEGTFDAYLWQIIENKQRFISQIITSKTPVRDCADIDEVALSYAEIKSLCAGNPKIKERMDLDVEVTKLKLLKSEYDSNKFRLEDDIRINYPNRITKRESHIEAVKQDLLIRAQHPLLKDDFVGMEIHGVRYTDKKSAGAAIIDTCKLLPAGAEAQHIGNYRGFQMDVAYSLLDIGFTFVLRGSASYRCSLGGSPEGNIQRIDNLIASLDTYLEDDERSLVNLKNQLEIAKVEVDKPFSHEEELKEKSARLARLDAELNIDQAESDINIEVSPDEEWLDFIENGGSLRDIPEENLNVAICTAAVEKSHYAFNYVPDRFKTAELCETAVLADVSHFQNIPAEYATPQLAEKAFEKSPWAFEKIPDCAKTPSLCERAVQQQSGNLAYVPEQFKSKELCLSAFEKAASVLKYIPAEFLTDEMCITAINSTWLSLDDIPDELRTFDVCLAAVAKRAFNLSAVPEGLKTPEFYATACKAYSQTHSDTLLLNRIPSAIKDQVLQLMHKLPEKGSKESTVTAKSSGKLFDINSLSADAVARAATRNSASADLPNHNDHSLDHK